MIGVTHPFFGNQYTNGGYLIGSFKFPEGLTREIGEQLAKMAKPNNVPLNMGKIPSVSNSVPLESVVKSGSKGKWIIPALVIVTIAATGSYFAYKYFKKKGIVKIPNVGICEFCENPLTGSKFIPDENNPYIVCKKCDEKNFAKHSYNENPENLNEARKEENSMDREELKSQIDELMKQYSDEEIDSETYSQKMMELTSSYQDEKQTED